MIAGIIFLDIEKKQFVIAFDVPQILASIFNGCMSFVVIFLPVIITIVIIQSIGELVARKDESDIMLVFDKKDLENGNPILIYKKKLKNKSVTVREFYTTIPMSKWQKRKDDLADIMDVHFVGDIEYGGKSNGNIVRLKTAKGRKLVEREPLYDENL